MAASLTQITSLSNGRFLEQKLLHVKADVPSSVNASKLEWSRILSEKCQSTHLVLSKHLFQTLVFIRGEQIIAKSADAQHKPLPSAKQVLNSDISLYVAPCIHVSRNSRNF